MTRSGRAGINQTCWGLSINYVIISALRVGFFNIGSGRVGYWTKYRVAGRVGSGRSVEIYDRVFPGIFFTLGYFRVCRVFSCILGYFRVFSGISGYVGYLQV